MAASINDLKSLIKYWLPVVIYAILIFSVSSIPGKNIPYVFRFQDVFFHALEYALFALLLSRALRAYNPEWIYIRRFIWVIVLGIVYACSDELHQYFIPGRMCSLVDVAWDSVGIFIGNLLYR